jgi:ribosomal protein S18 acetylase RimI-like enzyme
MMASDNQLRYQKCSEVEDRFIYQAFQIGFSDYIIKMEMSFEDFMKRFFGPEGNSKEHSFIAFDQEEPVGVILGGMKNYETVKTMRCGTLAVHPDYRGKGISQRLFELHKEEAIHHCCKQLFLEVIVGNDRAIHFYQKRGYEKIYDIVYFSNEDLSQIKRTNTEIEVTRTEFQSFRRAAEKWTYHINWQNDLDYLEKVDRNIYYHALVEGKVAGCMAINPSGNISFLMVDPAQRGKGIGSQLLQTAIQELNLSRMSTGFPNNSLLEGFFKKQGFKKGTLTQYEMYSPL